jgi:hypothetical protein
VLGDTSLTPVKLVSLPDQAQRSRRLPSGPSPTQFFPFFVFFVSLWFASPWSNALSYPLMFSQKPLVSSLGQEEGSVPRFRQATGRPAAGRHAPS